VRRACQHDEAAVGFDVKWGVRQTLTFGGVGFTVAVPWSALT